MGFSASVSVCTGAMFVSQSFQQEQPNRWVTSSPIYNTNEHNAFKTVVFDNYFTNSDSEGLIRFTCKNGEFMKKHKEEIPQEIQSKVFAGLLKTEAGKIDKVELVSWREGPNDVCVPWFAPSPHCRHVGACPVACPACWPPHPCRLTTVFCLLHCGQC